MKSETLHLTLFAACALILTVALMRESGTVAETGTASDGGPDTLAAIPQDALFIASLDLTAPQAGHLRRLLFNTEHQLGDLGRLTDVCGYDPSPHVEELAIAVLPGGAQQTAGFGIVARGSFEPAKLTRCATQLISSRGGTPRTERSGAIVLIRDTRAKGMELALLDNGLVLVSAHAQLRQMLQVLDGHLPSVRQNSTHRTLRGLLDADAAVVASLELDAGWLERLFPELSVQRSALVDLSAAAVQLRLGNPTQFRALLSCREPAGCERLESFVGEMRRDLAPALAQQLGSAALSGFKTSRQGQVLRLDWEVGEADLQRLLRHLSESPAALAEPKPAKPATAPDEIINARPTR